MLGSKTVFVLGAGASLDLGFPLGQDLQRQIHHQVARELEQLPPSHQYGAVSFNQFEQPVSWSLNQTGHALGDIRDALQRTAQGILESASIDAFLHNNRHHDRVVAYGKLAILWAIMSGESKSPLYDAEAAKTFCNQRGLLKPHTLGLPSQYLAISNSYVAPIWDELSEGLTIENLDKIFDDWAAAGSVDAQSS